MKKPLFFMIVTLLLLPSIIIAQATATTCPDIVNIAIEAANELCEGLERNSICYGNFKLDATPQDGVERFYFDRVGDIASVNDLARLEMSPMKEDVGEWGVAVMALQANLPNTLPGQNVTFILFGDVTLENATTQQQVENGEFSPMQAFYLTTGIGDSNCAEAPESGMLVQTPEGVGSVNFVVNGVEVAMGSTVFFQAETPDQLIGSTVEGAATFTVDDETYPIVAGTRFGIAESDDDGGFEPLMDAPESYELEGFEALPLDLLEREIEIEPPFDEAQLEELQRRIDEGLPLCGEEPFPPCEALPEVLGGIDCIFPEAFEDNIVPDELLANPICEASAFFVPIPVMPIEGVNCVLEQAPNEENSLPLCSDLASKIEEQLQCVMRPPAGEELPEGETRPFCDELAIQPPLDCVMRPPAGEELPEGETRPFCEGEFVPPLEGCVMPPAPGEELPEGETRPLCETNLPPVDDRTCIMRPGPNDPPLPITETRPFCEEGDVTPPPPTDTTGNGGNVIPPPDPTPTEDVPLETLPPPPDNLLPPDNPPLMTPDILPPPIGN
ncbi:MAG: hypothetical protein SFZ02_17045 [bacterium]|nr:hypothetical protein [bacterium]